MFFAVIKFATFYPLNVLHEFICYSTCIRFSTFSWTIMQQVTDYFAWEIFTVVRCGQFGLSQRQRYIFIMTNTSCHRTLNSEFIT